jgi:hypothetical protein
MDAQPEKLDEKHNDVVDLLRSRSTEQAVLDILDEPTSGK